MYNLTVLELKQKAKHKGISGYSKMRKNELLDILKNPTWTIYTRQGCSYCEKTKKILTNLDIKFTIIKITDKNKNKIYKKIDPKTGSYRFFPIIFEKDRFVGGYTELENELVEHKNCLIL
jgi:glutaredoxin